MIRFLISFFFLFSAPVFAEEIEPLIWVTGVGEVTTAPDLATIQIGVSTDARTAGEAIGRNSQETTNVLESIKKNGVPAEDIQTAELSLFPNFENRTPGKPPSIIGYRAQNMLSVKVRSLGDLGTILDEASKAGANVIHSIRFGRDKDEDLMNEARKLAINDAKSKASLYAEEAGITLGKVVSIRESGGVPRGPQPMARMETLAASVPVSQGQVSLGVSLQVVFEIE